MNVEMAQTIPTAPVSAGALRAAYIIMFDRDGCMATRAGNLDMRQLAELIDRETASRKTRDILFQALQALDVKNT